MNLVTVESSMAHAAGYDPERRELEVIFTTGHIYRYGGVPPDVLPALLAADSKGKFLRAHVLGVYPFVRLSRGRAPRRTMTRSGATRSGTPSRRAGSGRPKKAGGRPRRGSR